MPIDSTVKPSPITPNRSDFDLPEESIILCSFNHDYKISPYIFNVWMEILKEIPNSVLWLMKLNDIAENNLINELIKVIHYFNDILFIFNSPNIDPGSNTIYEKIIKLIQ